ncbi:MAG: MHYT domain-containing protein [Xanthobacteraceae bacterium]|nr:MHYT domain-containing protein [Xanthobacteraceae bacterium]
MFQGHDPALVALSVAIAILGGYTGFGLAARIRGTPDASHRLLLAGAAGFLAVGIWTMHFVGMLAAPLPADAAYLVLPTIISFLICALVVGVSLFFVSVGEPSLVRVVASAVLLGVGIVSMHYVGMHALSGRFDMINDPVRVALAVAIAIGAAYGGLRIFIARQGGVRLAASAIAFGIAVSGMHYTAMSGMHLVECATPNHPDGLVASQQLVSLVVALLCFVIAAGFLLSLVPDRRHAAAVTEGSPQVAIEAATPPVRPTSLPLGGIGQPRAVPATRLPVEDAEGTRFIDAAEVRSIHADAHYTMVHDGTRERLCPWSISEAEAQLDPAQFIRVHRSYIVALPHVSVVRKEGEGAVIQLDGPSPHRIPVSRAKLAEVKARLGLARRGAGAG